MRLVEGVALFAALLFCRHAHAQTMAPYGPPPPPPLPDGYARALTGEGATRLLMWRPATRAKRLLVLAEDEPSLAKLDRRDLLEIARQRGMSVLFLGPAPQPEALRKALKDAGSIKKIGVARGAAAEALNTVAQEKLVDALLLEDAVAPSSSAKGPFVIELYGSDAFWRKAPRPQAAAAGPRLRRFFLAGAVIAAAGEENCGAPLNRRSIEPARRALLIALDDYLSGGPAPPASREAELQLAKNLAWPKIPGLPTPPVDDRLAPKIDVDGNETSGLRLPDQALPIATFTGWNASKDASSAACAAGSEYAFPPTRAAREAANDPRQSLMERYGARSYFVAALRSVANNLVKDRLLLSQDADAYVAAGKEAPF
ncbi:MAG TPA: alpha/beta hydrolase domain-containing protein [Methylocystis sp.]|nr:alpha/beta hydrolase domain-containing protein [Methylocystis sp.]